MSPPPEDGEPPDYRVYRSRRSPFRRHDRDDQEALARLRSAGRGRSDPGRGGRRRRLRRPTPGRLVRWLLLAVVGWIVLSVALFLISAQIEQGKLDSATDHLLGGAGFPLTSANNILVLGSDLRPSGSKEPGAETSGPSRSDSIMLMRVGGGANSRLSIARDTVVNIPGGGRQKINAAYAIGGAPLAVQTIEEYLGVDVNHVVLVSFSDFPELIDAMGGIDYRGGCVVSRINGGFKNGGFTLRLKAGQTHIDGRQALALARTRKNACAPNETDLTRAHRQQKIFSGMKQRLLSPGAFIRLPWISWHAPRAIRTDMSGPTLLGLFAALSASGTPKTHVLGTLSGEVPDAMKAAAVRRFMKG